MKKPDLKSGMVISLRDWKEKFILIGDALCSATGKDFLTLSSYDDDLKNKISSGDQLDVVEVYKCKYPNVMSCFIDGELELLWKREEIDWDKVIPGTKVLVSDQGKNWYEEYFIRYETESEKFKTINNLKAIQIWNYCKLAEKPKEVTYEEIKKEFNTHCSENRCVNCKYYKENQCKFIYILDNYNVTRKDSK